MKALGIYILALSIYTGTILGVAHKQISEVAAKVNQTKHSHPAAQMRKNAGLKVINSVKCFLDGFNFRSVYIENVSDKAESCTHESAQ